MPACMSCVIQIGKSSKTIEYKRDNKRGRTLVASRCILIIKLKYNLHRQNRDNIIVFVYCMNVNNRPNGFEEGGGGS